MDYVKLRAWWHDRQGLTSPNETISCREVLARFGWARSVGGANPYLQIYARNRASRAQIDADLESVAIQELPCARGCTYVLPSDDFAVGLLCGQGFATQPEINSARKFLDYTDAELAALCDGVLAALAEGPVDPKDLRTKLGELVRNFGEAGKKRGLTTSLPLALGLLQEQGRIRRIPADGRLDRQRYTYCLWPDAPIESAGINHDSARSRLAKSYWEWLGVARVADFRSFSAFTVAATKAAIASLDLEPVEPGSEWLIQPSQREAFSRFEPPARPSYALIGSIDSLIAARRSIAEHLDAEDVGRTTYGEKQTTAGSSLLELTNHAIVDRGRIIGLWEFDPEAGDLVHDVWIPMNDDLLDAIARTERFVRDDLGDARSFSLDSPASRKQKIAGLRSCMR